MTAEYKEGWVGALSKALQETYTIHTEDGTFKVVQEETLIGLMLTVTDTEERR